MKVETRGYIRECIEGLSSVYRTARHLVFSNGNGQEPDRRSLYDLVFNDVRTALIECSQRVDLWPEDLKPEHEIDWIFSGIQENKDIFLLALQHGILPHYIDRRGKTRLSLTHLDSLKTVKDYADFIYETVQEANRPNPLVKV